MTCEKGLIINTLFLLFCLAININYIDTNNTGEIRSDLMVAETLRRVISNSNSKVRPNYTGPPTVIYISLHILRVGAIKELDGTFILDLFFHQRWYDYRLRHNLSESLKPLLGRKLPFDYIWTPDSVFVNAQQVDKHVVVVNNDKWEIHPNGTVEWSTRVTAESTCLLNLRKFPLDMQSCYMEIESYTYTTNHLQYIWKNDALTLNSTENSQFSVTGYSNDTFVNTYDSGSYVILRATFILKRRIEVFIIQVFFPSIGVVCVSWIALLIHKNCTSARIGIGVTTLLTITYIWFSVNRRLPRVSYVKAIDIYFITSFTFVFLTILEYAAVLNIKWNEDDKHYNSKNIDVKDLRKQREKKKKKFRQAVRATSFIEERRKISRSLTFTNKTDNMLASEAAKYNNNNNRGLRRTMSLNDGRRTISKQESFTKTKYIKEKKVVTQKDVRGRLIQFHYSTDVLCRVENPIIPEIETPKIEPKAKGKEVKRVFFVAPNATVLDKVSRVLFPLCYLVFNIFFWLYYSNVPDSDIV